MDNEKERNPIVVKVGQRIQKYRTQQNLTQEQVAERAGISQKHLSRIEQGYHNPRFDMIIQKWYNYQLQNEKAAKSIVKCQSLSCLLIRTRSCRKAETAVCGYDNIIVAA